MLRSWDPEGDRLQARGRATGEMLGVDTGALQSLGCPSAAVGGGDAVVEHMEPSGRVRRTLRASIEGEVIRCTLQLQVSRPLQQLPRGVKAVGGKL